MDTVSIVFTGDIGFDKYMFGQWDDEELLSEEVLDFLHSADHVVANVEGPIVNQPQNEIKEGVNQLLHTMDPGALKVLSKMKADIWNICNNHIMDAGPLGIEATLKEAAKAGVKTIGAGMNIEEAARPVYIDRAGGIGMFGVGYQRACRKADIDKAGCLSWSDLELVKRNIDEIKSKCKWCIVVAHAGEEFTSLPSPYTRERFHLYLDMGADAVICHHPHVPMNYETVGDKFIFYSLGNFIFDTDYQRTQFNTDIGLLIKLMFTEDKMSFVPLGLRIDRECEHVIEDELPLIFRDVNEEEYNKLIPLSTKAFIEATKRQQAYLNPKELKDATDAVWEEHFTNPMRTGRVPGETLDFFILRPLAAKESEKAWETSKMEDVKRYILNQL
ncbi:MAG: CapA family protein [Clostridia bacterium]|nr:CapA family protein [Clostridia bacterium]